MASLMRCPGSAIAKSGNSTVSSTGARSYAAQRHPKSFKTLQQRSAGCLRPAGPSIVTRAVPVPQQDVIAESDETVLLTLEEQFRMADIDNNGRIDRSELKVLLESVEGGLAYPLMVAEGWLSEERLNEAMEKYDKDKSGDIDFDEFQQLVYDGMILEGAVEEYEEAFRAVDHSGNGLIGATELAQLFKNLGSPLPLERVAEVFMKYDKDQSGQIDFGEFLAMFQDRLLDLQRVQSWLTARPAETWQPGQASLLQTVEGCVSVVFSESEVEEALRQHSSDKLVVIFCGLTWCRPCKAVGRPYEKLASAYSQHAVFLKLFGNANPSCKRLFSQFKIRSTPSFLFFRNSELVGTCTGANKSRFEEALRSHMRPEDAGHILRLYPQPETAAVA